MIELSDITIDSKELFDKYFSIKQYETSEFTFTNLFMWRNCFNIKYAIINDFLCIFAQYKNNDPFTLMPIGTGDIKSVIQELMTHFKQQGKRLIMKALTKDMIHQIESAFPDRFTFTFDLNISDYVYLSSDLIHLKGKKFHAKRNHINKFVSTYHYTYYPLTVNLIDECIAAADEWCRKKNCEESESLMYEKEAILRALNHFERLKFKGGVIKVDGKVIAFTFGEQFTDDMAVIHVEKADPDMQGSYALINQKFCETEWSHVKYINREEDMGIPGLRKAKRSYRPVRMVEKHIATLNE
ncbi:MAG: uncharacterized protein PWP27_1265 [Clostridiales bacterium]|jgi:hypothetical protein|nr:uncharacterized protein [Clostridiales bacterium]MDK2933455.1 uncharacterized protein [Clostridiales bacterium]